MISTLKQKIGIWPKELLEVWKNKNDWIWFHGVSLGEINAILPLILETIKNKPNYPVMVSTTTKAGYKHLESLAKKHQFTIFYFPFDIPIVIKKMLKLVKIKILVIAETEIWPSLLNECKKRNIISILVNARLSDKSYKNYYFLRDFFKPIINNFTEIMAQSEMDTERFLSLGIDKTKINTLGNLKFVTPEIITNISQNNKNIIFASTHAGEDEIAVEIYKKIKLRFKEIKFIIAPRHIDRKENIINLIIKSDLSYSLWSIEKNLNINKDIILVDTIGDLQELFKNCFITILCGTFTKIGGHNILEPIRAGSFTIIGPYDFKIKSLSEPFLKEHALSKVGDTSELIGEIEKAITNEEYRKKKIENGIRLINENKDVLENTKNRLFSYL